MKNRVSWLFFSLILLCTPLRGQMTGLMPLDSEEYYAYPEWNAPDLPSLKGQSVLLTEYMPEAGDQGNQASCTAWALGYAAMSYLEAVRRGREPDDESRIFSPSYIYNQIAIVRDGKDSGSRIVDGLNLLREQGVPPIEVFEYTDTTIYRNPSVEVRSTAENYKIRQFGRLTNTQGIKTALRLGYPVVLAIQTSPQFMQRSGSFEVYNETHFDRGQVEWETMAQEKGIRPEEFIHHLHAMTVVGYDDRKKAFLVINSWGKDWGIQNPSELQGFCWMSYDLFERIGPSATRFCREAWVLTHNRAMHPRSLTALDLQRDQVEAGVIFHSASWEDPEGGWDWNIWLSPYSEREPYIQSITWEIKQGRQTKTVVSKRDEGDGLMLRGTSNRVDAIPVSAIVAFDDGSRAVLNHQVWIINEPDYLQDRFRVEVEDEYYGRIDGKPTWVWIGWIEGDEKHYPNVTDVTWSWNDGQGQKSVISNASEYGFDIEGRVQQPTLVRATIELKGGQKVTPIHLIELFDPPVDVLKLQVSPSVGPEGWGMTTNLLGPLMIREQIAEAIYHLPDAYGGSQTVTDSSGWGEFNLYDLELTTSRHSKPEPFSIRLELHFKDGTLQTLTGEYVPFEDPI